MKTGIVTTRYLSSACNNTPHSLDWHSSGLIAYAAYCNVAIYDPQNGKGGKILYSLTNHKTKIISVKWVLTPQEENQKCFDLVSCSLDKTAILWKYTGDNTYLPYHLRGHIDTVEHIDAVIYNNVTLIATTSADSTVRLWMQANENDEVKCTQTITIPSKSYNLHVLCVRIILLPESNSTSTKYINALILCSADDCNVYIYVLNMKSYEMVKTNVQLEGHENWIRALDYTFDNENNLFIASGSQDNTIRIWKISSLNTLHSDGEFQTKEEIININSKPYYVTLESVLLGHEGWVYGVHWHPKLSNGSTPLQLLSCSMDKSIIVWAPDAASGIWLESARVGEVGGNTLGFYGCKFGPSGKFIIGHGFQGSLHLWGLQNDVWKACVTVGGHFGIVRDIQWEPSGQFIVSVSEDQTTRLHAPLVRLNTWHEMARLQVHGYDLTCLAIISTFMFASGADEKVVRAYKTTVNFVDNIQRLCNVDFSNHSFVKNELQNCPIGASVPALGLSNMAIESDKEKSTETHPEVFHLTQPPTEEDLVQNTLWPEIQKLYGHGYEIYSIAASHDGKFLASACKASKPEHASVILWDVATWKQIQTLPCHQLTITQLSFSPDDNYLLSVSRDRRWGLYKKELPSATGDNNNHFKLIANSDKLNGVHKRIIWSCAWSHNTNYFLTSSRDGLCVIWSKTKEDINNEDKSSLGCYSAVSQLELKEESFTSLALAPVLVQQNKYLISIGTESGTIYLYTWTPETSEWKCITTLTGRHGHQSVVNRLQFRPVVGIAGDDSSNNNNILQLCSAGGDHFVKVFDVNLERP